VVTGARDEVVPGQPFLTSAERTFVDQDGTLEEDGMDRVAAPPDGVVTRGVATGDSLPSFNSTRKGIPMPLHVLVLQGAGEGAYAEDVVIVERLLLALGDGYAVVYPAMANDGEAPYEVWREQIDGALARLEGPVILVGHSVGGSVLAKYLAEATDRSRIAGVFLLAAPFWGSEGWRYEGYEELELPTTAGGAMDLGTPIFLYHCTDDEVVPVDHRDMFLKRLTGARGRVLDDGGHQFDADLGPIVEDIRGLE
jgi:predicted alpha/beta hydrolase family esterase